MSAGNPDQKVYVYAVFLPSNNNVLPKFMSIFVSGVYLVFEVFQGREFKEMLALSYLGLQACISFSRRFKTRVSQLPCSHKNAVAHVSGLQKGPEKRCRAKIVEKRRKTF